MTPLRTQRLTKIRLIYTLLLSQIAIYVRFQRLAYFDPTNSLSQLSSKVCIWIHIRLQARVELICSCLLLSLMMLIQLCCHFTTKRAIVLRTCLFVIASFFSSPRQIVQVILSVINLGLSCISAHTLTLTLTLNPSHNRYLLCFHPQRIIVTSLVTNYESVVWRSNSRNQFISRLKHVVSEMASMMMMLFGNPILSPLLWTQSSRTLKQIRLCLLLPQS